jgi:hypothetical protein
MRITRLATILIISGALGCSPGSQAESGSALQNTERSSSMQPAPPTDRGCVRFDPAVIELRGTLTTVTRYGPPNFGENPESDEKLNVPLLTLPDSLLFCAEPGRPADTETVHINQLQLNFAKYGDVPAELLGREVLVTGTALLAVSGYHFTPVLLTVSRIGAAPSDER